MDHGPDAHGLPAAGDRQWLCATVRHKLAADLGATVVHAERRGYGAACHAGLVAATAPLIAVMDADASLDPLQLPDLIAPLVRGEADLVVGARRLTQRRAQPWTLRVANAELARRVRRRTGLPLRDIGPMRAARREALLGLDIQIGDPAILSRPWCGLRMPAGALSRSTPTISFAAAARRSPARRLGLGVPYATSVRCSPSLRRDRPRRHDRLGQKARGIHCNQRR